MGATTLVQCNCELCAQTMLLVLHRVRHYMAKHCKYLELYKEMCVALSLCRVCILKKKKSKSLKEECDPHQSIH